jgi:hypothetical protein
MQKQCLLMGFIWNIKQHTIDHEYSKPHYVLVDFEINTLKKGNTFKFPPILPSLHSHQNNNKFTRF